MDINIIPLVKNKCVDITDINNYRAIALCNVETKILEKKSFFLKLCHTVIMISISLALNDNIQLHFVLYLLCLTNMLPSSPNSPGASLHQTHGFLLPSVHFGPPSAMLKTSGNALTLLVTGL